MSRVIQHQLISEIPLHLIDTFWKTKISSNNYRASKKGYEGCLSVEGVINVFEKQGESCAFCESREYLVIDHVIPLSHGGLNVETNIQFLCSKCNSRKGNKDNEVAKEEYLFDKNRQWKTFVIE